MKVKFTVLGMSCSACSSAVERAVNKIDGVSMATVSLTQKLLVVEGDFLVAEIIKAVKNAGFKARLYSDKKSEDNGLELKKRLIFSVICLVVLMCFSMGAMIGLPTFNFLKGEGGAIYFVALQIILATPVIIINKKFFINGYKAVIHLAPNMDTLVALGSLSSYLFGIFAFVMIIIGGHPLKGAYRQIKIFFINHRIIRRINRLDRRDVLILYGKAIYFAFFFTVRRLPIIFFSVFI